MKKKKLEAWLRVLDFNARFPVGTYVEFDHLIYGRDGRAYKTVAPAAVIWRSWPVVWLRGKVGAVGLDHVRVIEADDARIQPRPLLCSTHALGLLLNKRPGMTHYLLPLHLVHSEWFNPQAVNLSLAPPDVLEGESNFSPRFQAEGIEHAPDLLCRNDTVQVGLVLRDKTELRGKLGGRLEVA